MASVFWVEDQSHWIDRFQHVLTKADLDGVPNTLTIYRFAETACQALRENAQFERPDIALLDARTGANDHAGFSVARLLKSKWPDLPIVFLSEHNGTTIEQTALEDHNVTDFISKHQKNIEQVLCWRIRTVLRQSALRFSQPDALPSGVIERGALRIDLDNWEVYWSGTRLMNPDNPRRPLAPMPRRILRVLVEHTPRPITVGQMAAQLQLDTIEYSTVTYRQHIKTLRRAFDQTIGATGRFLSLCKAGFAIATCGDEGAYCWRDPPESEMAILKKEHQ